MKVRLADVNDVKLDQAYRRGLPSDSVGLVRHDPDDAVDSVNVAVDADAKVVDQVPRTAIGAPPRCYCRSIRSRPNTPCWCTA